MKQAKNNEIDLLLRKLARGQRAGSIGSSLDPGLVAADEEDRHLDADELNSYAENAVPSASRARYTEHLAECAMCRKIVVQLSMASGTSVQQTGIEARTPSSVGKYLASFFSSSILRYVVPTFAVVAIAAVALVMLKQNRRADFVAQRQASSTTPSFNDGVNQAPATAADTKNDSATAAAKRTVETKQANKAAQEPPQEKALAKTAAFDSAQRIESRDKDQQSSVGAKQPELAQEPARPSAKPVSEQEADRNVAKEKKQESSEQPSISKLEDRPRNANEVAAEAPPSPRKAANSRIQSRSVGGMSSQGASSNSVDRRGRVDNNRDDESEIRSVAGHRFRKQGSVWVDVAYESSRTTVNLARGSEQYRALVADEPGISTIAQQLEGEVIIVWKARAYRIR